MSEAAGAREADWSREAGRADPREADDGGDAGRVEAVWADEVGTNGSTFGTRLERRPVVQRIERGLVRKIRRDVGSKRSRDVGVGERVLRQRRDVAEQRQRLIVRLLECVERALEVLPLASIDLAWREAGAVERHLRREHFADDWRSWPGGGEREGAAQQGNRSHGGEPGAKDGPRVSCDGCGLPRSSAKMS